MKLLDIILAFICGEAAALLINDLFEDYSLPVKFLQFVFLFLMPILAILFLWFADFVAQRFPFIWQLAKHLLVGLLVVLIDLKIFIFLINLTTIHSGWISGTAKAISFLVSVSTIKFLGNKYWAFSAQGGPYSKGVLASGEASGGEERRKDNLGKQFSVFLIVTLIGLIIDVSSFLSLTKIIMPQFGLSSQIWVKISVILAAVVAAAWNFLTYKFIVFPARGGSALGGNKQDDSSIS